MTVVTATTQIVPKLIITDLDGTLLRTDKTVSEYTKTVRKLCQEQGILFAFATARSEKSASKYIEILKPDVIISNGGAVVNYRGEVIYTSLLSAETVTGIIQMCMEATDKKGKITIEAEDNCYYWNYKQKPEASSDYAYAIYTDFSDFHQQAYKITAELEREEDGIKIAAAYPECFALNFRGEIWRRFANRTANKRIAIQKLAEHLHLLPADIIAFGDDSNDIEMLKYCGNGVAVKNAITEVQQIADYITESNDDDGVARFLEKYVLGQSHY